MRLSVKAVPERGFYRCGMKFTTEPLEVDVDEATAERLRDEPMLVVEEVTGASLAGNSGGSGEDLKAAVQQAIAELDPDNPDHWLKDGRPDVKAIEEIINAKISAAERDVIWEEMQQTE